MSRFFLSPKSIPDSFQGYVLYALSLVGKENYVARNNPARFFKIIFLYWGQSHLAKMYKFLAKMYKFHAKMNQIVPIPSNGEENVIVILRRGVPERKNMIFSQEEF